MTMTPEAKRELSKTIRGLRAHLLGDRNAKTDAAQRGALHAATESAYRLGLRVQDAGLDEAALARRRRLSAWIEEQVRAEETTRRKAKTVRGKEDFRREAEQQAAYTLVNRLVILRLMEAAGGTSDGETVEPLRSPPVVTGGWGSRGYQDFRQLAPAIATSSVDESEGYAYLLELVFQDLATDMPGLFGPAGVADLVRIPAATLRRVVETLDQPELASCWTDDMTLGWVYQYWNDPERERLDDKLKDGKKLAPHEIASKTQMFTERYMVDWLLQNSLGPMWLAMCRKQGWTADVEAPGPDSKSLLDRLEERRVDWRGRRERGEVSLTELMPLHTNQARRWAYFVPQPIPDDAVEQAPDSARALRILDPAVGSGHFLVVAMDLLAELYREEARHRNEVNHDEWSDRRIVESILERNLHGIDLDPRAVQIAAAALWLKGRRMAPDARPKQLHLVASNLRLAALAHDDPALVELRSEVERETGVPGALTDRIVEALHGADHLGSLLRIDQAVTDALEQHERSLRVRRGERQTQMWSDDSPVQTTIAFDADAAQTSVLGRLESFLARHSRADDLGLRLRGEQLAAGVRFARLVGVGTYDLVVANPPYQGTSSLADAGYFATHYPLGKADLYAAFLLRGLELVREGGVSAMLTMRNWMFIKQYSKLRNHVLESRDVRALGDFAVGAFDEVPNDLLSVVVSVVHRTAPRRDPSVAQQPTAPDDNSYDRQRTKRKRAATLCQVGTHTFQPNALQVVPEWPLVYWWDDELLQAYQSMPLLGEVAPARMGANVGDNTRFHRRVFEIPPSRLSSERDSAWTFLIKGAAGKSWIEPAEIVVHWRWNGTSIKQRVISKFGEQGLNWKIANSSYYFRRGVAFSMIGANFSARVHRLPSVFGDKGSSVFPDDTSGAVCSMNSSRARRILESLNPSVSFQVGDVNRLPLFPIARADEIFGRVQAAFAVHESHREASVEFQRPGSSAWRYAQKWAQRAVDRPHLPVPAPLPAYEEELDPELATDPLSFAVGVALGRFGPDGEGVLDPTRDDLSHALPAGLLFLDRSLAARDYRDSLGHAAAARIHAAWETHSPRVETKRDCVRSWLAHDFFKDVHCSMYEKRPIHWPLSSAKKNFVAWVNIHRFTRTTLRELLADHLHPALARIEGELDDVTSARTSADRQAARSAEQRYGSLQACRGELCEFIANVEQCADRGAPPTDAKCPPREQDARYAPDLDDGVMINSAALWPLLEPQWKDPKKWWKELCIAKGRKDYDWSHLALCYWPTRVDEKCRKDPSLGVAHGCFWRYHPERAWAWELRLQDEIGPEFRIEEKPYRPGGREFGDEGDAPHRAAWLRDHTSEALAAVEKEAVRRMGRGANKRLVPEMRILEPGLWSALPGEIWEMELRLTKKQGADLRLLAPDEPEARAAYVDQHPKKAEVRADLLRGLVTKRGFFDAEGAE